jgi:putative oxidoreductase
MKALGSWLFARHTMESRSGGIAFGLLVTRVLAGAFMLTHGWGKLVHFAERSAGFPDPLGVGSAASLGLTVFAEFFCAILVILGLATRFAAIPLLITMLVAAFVIHGSDPWSDKEFPLLYAAIWLGQLFAGPGRFSLDRLLARKRT